MSSFDKISKLHPVGFITPAGQLLRVPWFEPRSKVAVFTVVSPTGTKGDIFNTSLLG